MESEKLNNYNSFQHFIKLQSEIIDNFSIGINNSSISVLKPEELFRFLDEQFKELHEKEFFRVILAYIHQCFKVWISKGDYLDDIAIHLVNLIMDHCKNDTGINIVIQIIYQVLHSIKTLGIRYVPLHDKLLRELIAIVPLISSRTTASNCIACIEAFLEINPESWRNLEALWSYLKKQFEGNLKNGITNEIEIDILLNFIDYFNSLESNFHCETIVIKVVQNLLQCHERKFRKCGYFLLKKIHKYFINCVNTGGEIWILNERHFVIYVAILENLEEEQSHLILPSLENLEELVKIKGIPVTWMNILYAKLLSHNNSLVLRWSIEFFLTNLSCSELYTETLKLLLKATNSNGLFNYEGYFLSPQLFSKFLKGDVLNLIRLISDIENWKAVPLYIWLEKLPGIQLAIPLTFEEILRISSCVRRLQNCTIRQKAIERCNQLFDDYIEKMSMEEYVTYVEAIYNPGDKYGDHKRLFSKKSSLIQSKSRDCFESERFYAIFTNSNFKKADLVSFLEDLPVEKLGWMKFALFKFELDILDCDNIFRIYNFDKLSNIHEVINAFKAHLLPNASSSEKHKLIECNKAAVSFFIYQLQYNNNHVDETTIRFILKVGISSNKAVDIFAKKILSFGYEKELDLWFIDEILKYKSNTTLKYVSDYLCQTYDGEIVRKYAIEILKICNFDINFFPHLNLLDYYKDEWLKKLPTHGDKRIEEAFSFNHFGVRNWNLPKYCLNQIKLYRNDQFVLDLLKYHTDITKRKPRYFENSTEHRVKLRIAICIHYSIADSIDIEVLNIIWGILLNENNQLNVTYIYENIVGKYESREHVIIGKLKEALSLSARQQVTIISVAYKYLVGINLNCELENTVAGALLNLTMCANFKTRLVAQMAFYKLAKDKFADECLSYTNVVNSLIQVIGDKFLEYDSDVRLERLSPDEILLITNTSFDELLRCSSLGELDENPSVYHLKLITFYRQNLNKFKVTKNEDTTTKNTINEQIQRKMNPIKDLTEPHNLIVYPIEKIKKEILVVASLIDNLPNLGGIARTCEVLGIKNLVMDSKKHTEKTDFKNLSMTAEKTLNILEVKPVDLKEFLVLKKLEGYNIIGAEQTCKSESFENFTFPQKCVLLLGHEKEGIPAPLLGILDNAVEIPQFGQIRSLNVHVTAALFMWEYCKQHLIHKE